MTTNRLPLLGWLFIVGWLSAAAASANAQPIAPAPDGTNTVVTPNGNRYDISGGSLSGDRANLFHSFTQFGLSEGQTANFLTNPNIQNILGRITGGNPSLINGLIKVTGGNSNLFLMNPAGMIFGPNASLNVPGSFNASAATGISFGNNQWFSAIGNNNWATLIGTPNSFAFTNLQGGSIVNAGNLTVAPGQSLTLIGGTVVNTGQLTAPSGNILISAVPGNNLVRISQAGNLLSLDVQPTATQSSLPNNWTQPMLSLPQLLTGKGLAQATGLVVNPNGEVVLTGNVAVPVVPGTAIASGSLNVSGNTGGTVNILGDRVGVIGGNINASGINGGGTVLVGGDYQGVGIVPNAARTFVSSDSTINADAVSNGNGGRVIVWADETTRFNGNITARGGLFSGNGGFVEVSGKQFLDFRGNVNTLATNGNPGLLLLDPTNITIQNGAGTFTALNQVAQFTDPDIGGNTIDAALINSAATNVMLQASNDITFNSAVNITTPGVGLTALANNNINVPLNSNITTQAGNITLNADRDNLNGGNLTINSTINTNGGNFLGIGRGNTLNRTGIFVNGTINAGGGDINLDNGSGNTTTNVGISLAGSKITTTGNGNITINGTSGSSNGLGIVLNVATISSVNGNITFNGTSTGAGTGIELNSSFVQSTGTGSITMTGTGGNGINNNIGVFVDRLSKIESLNGNISLTGTGGGTGTNNNGILIQNSSLVTSIGSGNITFKGTAGAGTDNNSGIGIANSNLKSQNGDITLTGTGAGTGITNTNYGILIESTAALEATAANITLTGKGANSDAIVLKNGSINPTANSGKNVTLTGDEIQLLGTTQVKGTGTIILQPLTPSLGILIGGTKNDASLNLNQAELDTFSGFSQMVIGRTDGTGAIAIDPTLGVTFNSPTIIEALNAPGSIAVNGQITANGGITFNGDTSLNANVIASDKNITFNNYVTLIKNVLVDTGTAGAGDIIFQKIVNGTNPNTQDLTLTAGTGNITFGGDVGSITPVGKLTINSAGNVQTKAITAASIIQQFDATGAVTVSGDLTATNGDISLKNPVTLSGNLTANNGDIKFFGLVTLNNVPTNTFIFKANKPATTGLETGRITLLNGFAAGSNNLTITSDEIDITGPSSGTGDLVLQPFRPGLNISLGHTGDLPDSLDMTGLFKQLQDGFKSIAIGRTDSSGAITIESPLTFRDPVTIRSPLGAGLIAILPTGSLTGTDNASITLTANQNITAGNITTTGTGDITLTSNIGTIALNGPIATSDKNITFNGPVTLQNNVLLDTGTAGAGNILFSNTVNGTTVNNQNLTLTAGTGNITFKGDVGNQSAIGNLQINNATDVQTAAITANSINLTATGKTTLNGAVKTNGAGGINLNVTNLAIDFPVTTGNNGTFTVNHSGGLNIATGANLVLDGAFTESGTGNVNIASNITTTNDNITLNNPVILTNNVALNTGAGNGNITFNKTVDGTAPSGQNLTLTAGTGNVSVNGAIGNNNALKDLTVNSTGTTAFSQTVKAQSLTTDAGGTTAINGNVTTTNAQTYGDAVTIANNLILNGSSITFKNTIDGNSNLTLDAGTGSISVSGAIGNNKVLNNLTANSKISLGGSVTTTANQTYKDAVTIAKNSIVTGDSITFNSTVDVAGDIGISGGDINLQGIVKTTNDGKLTITNKGNLSIASNLNLDGAFIQKGAGTVALSGNITTTNDNIIFSGPVTLKAPVNFALGDATIAFGSTLSAGDNPLNLTAGEIDFSGQVSGNKTLTLQPSTVGQNIVVGGTDNNTSALDLTASEINQIQNGFSSIAIGRSDSSGKISIPNNLPFLDPVSIQGGTGSIALDGTLTGNDNSSIALNASTINLNYGINTNKNPIALNGTVKLGNDINLSTGGGDIKIIGAIDGNHLLNLDAATGNVLVQGNIGGTAPLSVVNVKATKAEFMGNIASNSGFNIAAATTSLGSNVTTNQGNININGVLGLTKDAVLSTGGGNIAFGGAIDSIDAARNLNLAAGSGSITFSAPVGATGQLAKVAIKNAGDVTANSTINAQSLQVNSAGNINLLGNVTASNAGNGGAIELLSPQGKVNAKDLNTAGNTGGNITVKALNSITAGKITSFGTAGNAGNVFLDPIGDVQVGFINAQGGTSGNGGNVFVSSDHFVRATDSFPTLVSPTGFASISTAGGTGGTITIKHAGGDGGPPIQPFVVGGATINGTAAAITTGQFSITSQSFPRSSSVGNIAFSTDDAIDPITPTPTPSVTPTPTPSVTPTLTPSATPPQTIPPTTGTTPQTIPPITGTTPQTIPPITGTNSEIIPLTTGINSEIIPLTTGINSEIIPPITGTNSEIIPLTTGINSEIIPLTTGINQRDNQQVTVINQPRSQQVTVINQPRSQQENQQVTSSLESVEESLRPIAPVTTPASLAPVATPAPQPSAPDAEDFQRRRPIPPLDNPGVAADQILTLDSSIISQLPPSYQQPTVRNSEPPQSLNPGSNLVLGYAPPPDQLFEGNDIQTTVWGIEQIRNQEFGEYLGVKANLPDQKIMIATFQQTLRNIEQQTGKRSGIIYIISRVDRLELILVPSVGRPIHYSVPEANRAALFPTVKELRNEITNPAKRGTTTYLAAAQQLYKWAIAPLEKDLQNLGIQTLLLSVDPGLRSLPFAALHDGKGFLIEKYSFSLIPSFSLTAGDYRAVRDATVLAMGRSEFVDQKPLPSVPIELQAISAQWHGPSFLNSTFTIDNLNSEHAQGGFRIVHLATHAEFQAGKASNSYIQLWNSKLQLDRMESLNWRNPQVDLLVLSACRTALGDRDAELGFGGLAVKSGAKSALGSLWYVDDGGTLGLMSEFYHQLQGAATKAETLQLAQQAMIARKVRIENGQLVTTVGKLNLPTNIPQPNQDFSHPYYWSSFTLIGSPW